MDPNANLQRQLSLAVQLTGRLTDLDPEQLSMMDLRELSQYASELGEHVLALHQWICRGGFLPVPWQAENCGRTDDVTGK